MSLSILTRAELRLIRSFLPVFVMLRLEVSCDSKIDKQVEHDLLQSSSSVLQIKIHPLAIASANLK